MRCLLNCRTYNEDRVAFSPASDACPICESLAGDYDIEKCPIDVSDTHPRCRCARKPAVSEV